MLMGVNGDIRCQNEYGIYYCQNSSCGQSKASSKVKSSKTQLEIDIARGARLDTLIENTILNYYYYRKDLNQPNKCRP